MKTKERYSSYYGISGGELQRIASKYVDASVLFNNMYKTKRIDVLLDLVALNIYVRDLITNKSYLLQISNHLINDISIEEIMIAYKRIAFELILKGGDENDKKV